MSYSELPVMESQKPGVLIICLHPPIRREFQEYLSTLLGEYIRFDIMDPYQIHDPAQLDPYSCILFASSRTRDAFPVSIPEHITQLICTRTFNPASLDQIIRIPQGSSVYLVNDTQDSVLDILGQLKDAGITQYHFVPFYQGCTQTDESIQYAITLGEPQLVPRHVPNIINIGNRIIDISTIHDLCTCFQLPSSLTNQITRTYVNRILQIIQLTGTHYTNYVFSKQLLQVVMSNLNVSLCLMTDEGRISMVNRSFCQDWDIPENECMNSLFSSWLPSQYASHNFCQSADYQLVSRSGLRRQLSVLQLSLPGHKPLYLLSSQPVSSSPAPDITPVDIRDPSSDFYRLNSGFDSILSVSGRVLNMLEYARRLALYDFPVLIQGENGTQKKKIATAIHKTSSRRQNPLIIFNSLYTGLEAADQLKLADTGTLLIDGVERLPLSTQDTLISILQNTIDDLDIRIIATTSQDLYQDVLDGRFREELFFFLNAASIDTIPLRERREDIPVLMEHFFRELFHDPNIRLKDLISSSLMNFLTNYDYPGNIQELFNLSRYFFSLYSAHPLVLSQLPSYIRSRVNQPVSESSVLKNEVLSLIAQTPRIGRGTIMAALTKKEITVSDGKLRGLLKELAEEGLIRVGRTRSGCEITELGLASIRH